MIEIKPLNAIPDIHKIKIFLAGSIEKGLAAKWQESVVRELSTFDIVLLNPRRDSWDVSWEQNIDNPDFRAQVEWELKALEKSDYILMYFDPNTESPISLLELGLYARSGKLLVACPEGFWRKGNIDVVCKQYEVPKFSSLGELLYYIKTSILNKQHG